MAFTDVLLARWGGIVERLPARPEELHGPRDGIVVLPTHLTWHGLREFDVSRQESRLVLYSIVLGNGRRADVARFVNADRLAEDWPRLRDLLTRRLRVTCERRFGLAPATRGNRPPRSTPRQSVS